MDFTQPIPDVTGEPLRVGGQIVTLAGVCVPVLRTRLDGEPPLSPKDRVRLGELAEAIVTNGTVEIDAVTAAELRERVALGHADHWIIVKARRMLAAETG